MSSSLHVPLGGSFHETVPVLFGVFAGIKLMMRTPRMDLHAADACSRKLQNRNTRVLPICCFLAQVPKERINEVP